MLVQAGLCQTCSETTLLVFPRGGSNDTDASVGSMISGSGAAPVAERLRALCLLKSLDHLTAVSGVGSSPALATCETSQVLLAGVSGGFFSGFSRFRPTY